MKVGLPKILAVVGPTASGKTGIGLALARACEGEVICADSRTIYRDFDIGTAKPKGDRNWAEGKLGAERPLMVEGVPHWGIDIAEPTATFTASDFQAYADTKIEETLGRGHVPILVGGTGLYFAAVIDRPTFREVPPNPDLRAELSVLSNAQLLEEIALIDPGTAETIDAQNRRRLERALEVLQATGEPMRAEHEPARYEARFLMPCIEREALYRRIDERVDVMVASGLVDEVRALREKYGDDAAPMTGIGYRQIAAFLRGEMKLSDAVIRIKYDTHEYARRQLTWFTRNDRVILSNNAVDAVRNAQTFLTL